VKLSYRSISTPEIYLSVDVSHPVGR
jgi:hypothetical protein